MAETIISESVFNVEGQAALAKLGELEKAFDKVADAVDRLNRMNPRTEVFKADMENLSKLSTEIENVTLAEDRWSKQNVKAVKSITKAYQEGTTVVKKYAQETSKATAQRAQSRFQAAERMTLAERGGTESRSYLRAQERLRDWKKAELDLIEKTVVEEKAASDQRLTIKETFAQKAKTLT